MISFGVSPEKTQALADRMKELGIREADIQETFVRSGGAGGQHVNKTATCVQLTHEPSGCEIKMQKARSQALNRYYARKRLCELVEGKLLAGESPEAIRAEKIRKQKRRRKRRSASKPSQDS